MPTREQILRKDRADRALRAGRGREALGEYTRLLADVQVFEPGLYEIWLEGALGTYRALGRQREAGYVLLGLRRFGDAQACFPVAEDPLDFALCTAMQGRHAEAARVLGEAGHPALAAIELETAEQYAGARAEWERLLALPRLRGQSYETALAHFNLGEVLMKLGDQAGAEGAFNTTQRMLEELADDFETAGERQRAFECYGILLRLGRDTGSFENVAEGYLNSIRILSADDQKFYVLQYYEDFLDYAIERRELHAAATLAREAADYSLKAGLVYDRHYLRRSADLWAEAARANEAAAGPTDLSENALHAGIDAASSLGDLALCGKLYTALGALPLSQKKRERYAALARRYATQRPDISPATSFPEYLRKAGAYQDVWRQDLVEWELEGEPASVLARLVVEKVDHIRFSRLALRALLIFADPRFSLADAGAASELAVALGNIQVYEALRPLERMYELSDSRVRASVMRGVSNVYCKRSFGLVRRGLGEPGADVRKEALGALRKLRFRDGFDPLTRIFRESTDEEVRETALETIADIGSIEAGMFLVDVLRHETGRLQDRARERLSKFTGDDVVPLIRQHVEVETGQARAALQEILSALTAA